MEDTVNLDLKGENGFQMGSPQLEGTQKWIDDASMHSSHEAMWHETIVDGIGSFTGTLVTMGGGIASVAPSFNFR